MNTPTVLHALKLMSVSDSTLAKTISKAARLLLLPPDRIKEQLQLAADVSDMRCGDGITHDLFLPTPHTHLFQVYESSADAALNIGASVTQVIFQPIDKVHPPAMIKSLILCTMRCMQIRERFSQLKSMMNADASTVFQRVLRQHPRTITYQSSNVGSLGYLYSE